MEHPHGGGNHQHIGKASTVARDKSAGRKVRRLYCVVIHSCSILQWRRQLWGNGGTCPRLPTVSFLVHFGVNLTASYPKYCEISGADVNNSFDQYCISHKTISHRAAAAPGPEVHHEFPITYFPALPLLATNPGNATAVVSYPLFSYIKSWNQNVKFIKITKELTDFTAAFIVPVTDQ